MVVFGVEMDDMHVKVDVIAKLFGVSVRRIQQLTQDGILHTEKMDGGRMYPLVQTIQAYVKYLSDKAYGREQSDKETELKAQKLRAEIALKESQGELHRLKTDLAQGKYLAVDAVEDDYRKFFQVFKKFATSIPARVVGTVSGYVDPVVEREIERSVQTEINQMLRSFSVAGHAPEKDNP